MQTFLYQLFEGVTTCKWSSHIKTYLFFTVSGFLFLRAHHCLSKMCLTKMCLTTATNCVKQNLSLPLCSTGGFDLFRVQKQNEVDCQNWMKCAQILRNSFKKLVADFLWLEWLWKTLKATDIILITAIFCSKFT